MATERLAEQPLAKHSFTCRTCKQWVVTALGGWARACCVNRKCALFGQQQTMYANRSAIQPLRANDS